MIYYKIKIDCELISVKRLSLNIPLFRVLHTNGAVEIYNNPVSGKWYTLFRSNPKDTLSAEYIGPKIKLFYQSKYLSDDLPVQQEKMLGEIVRSV